ncbi:MAG: SBBP repeat-containing protein [Promethearchaeota archaeon]
MIEKKYLKFIIIFLTFFIIIFSNFKVSSPKSNLNSDKTINLKPKFEINVPNISEKLEWQVFYGNSSGNDYGNGLAVDSNNNIYLVGTFSNISADIIILKYDSSGVLLWKRCWSKGLQNDNGTNIAVDSGDNIYVIGYTWSGSEYDGILIKYNSSGNLIWSALIGESNGLNERIYGITVDSKDYIYLTGYKYNNSQLNNDLLIVKYNTTGAELWSRTWDSTIGGLENEGRDIIVDSNDDIYVIGHEQNLTSDWDITLVKFNSSGKKEWYKIWRRSNSDKAFGVAIDSQNNIYIAGETERTGGGFENMVLIKYNKSSSFIWERKWGILGDDDEGRGVIIDSKDNIYLTGHSDKTQPGNKDIWLTKYDSNGTNLINKTWGGSQGEYCEDIVIGKEGNIYIIGRTLSFGPGLNDIFLLKYIVAPGAFNLTSNAGNPDDDGLFTLIWSNSKRAINYSIYTSTQFITIINTTVIEMIKGIKITNYAILTQLPTGTYYYKVFAYNNDGSIASNCLKIIVELAEGTADNDDDDSDTTKPFEILGYNLFLLTFSFGIITISFIYLKYRNNNNYKKRKI